MRRQLEVLAGPLSYCVAVGIVGRGGTCGLHRLGLARMTPRGLFGPEVERQGAGLRGRFENIG